MRRPADEFDFIQQFTAPFRTSSTAVSLGIGDDCALLRVPSGHELAVTTDSVVEGVHFTSAFSAEEIGHKALAVNLSDLAAMGASPLAFVCALELPPGRLRDLTGIARGMSRLAARMRIPLAGGNVSRAEQLAITITAMGCVKAGTALRRDGASRGDALYVSGELGGAAAGLRTGSSKTSQRRQRRPEPRLALGRAARPIASAAIDISDGLLQDLGHLLTAAKLAAKLDVAAVPLQRGARLEDALRGGEDYELVLAVPIRGEGRLVAAARRARVRLTRIGTCEAGEAGHIVQQGAKSPLAVAGYDHFRSPSRPSKRRSLL